MHHHIDTVWWERESTVFCIAFGISPAQEIVWKSSEKKNIPKFFRSLFYMKSIWICVQTAHRSRCGWYFVGALQPNQAAESNAFYARDGEKEPMWESHTISESLKSIEQRLMRCARILMENESRRIWVGVVEKHVNTHTVLVSGYLCTGAYSNHHHQCMYDAIVRFVCSFVALSLMLSSSDSFEWCTTPHHITQHWYVWSTNVNIESLEHYTSRCVNISTLLAYFGMKNIYGIYMDTCSPKGRIQSWHFQVRETFRIPSNLQFFRSFFFFSFVHCIFPLMDCAPNDCIRICNEAILMQCMKGIFDLNGEQ